MLLHLGLSIQRFLSALEAFASFFSAVRYSSFTLNRNGRGAVQLPAWFFTIPCSIILMNCRSSSESRGLLSSHVNVKTSSPKPSSIFPWQGFLLCRHLARVGCQVERGTCLDTAQVWMVDHCEEYLS